MICRIALVLSLLLAVTARAERPSAADIDKLAKPLVELQWCPGIVVGLIDDQGPRVLSYGRIGDANSRTPDGDTLFEIGSVTKAFTGILLADMVQRGEVSLDDPVSKYLPGSVKMPQLDDKPITLAHLAEHTSGLPRLPTNFKPADPANPYADYTLEQMYAFLGTCKLKQAPGKTYEYSNLGMGLLGHVLSLKAGKGYEAIVTERILQPLGMKDTRIALDEAAKVRLAKGHNADGDPIANWDFTTLAGCGGLRSTANDLLKLVTAMMDTDAKAPLSAAFKLARTPRTAAMTGNQIGLAWHVGQDGALIWHNGQTGGYHAYVGFVPDRKVGVVVIANCETDLIDFLGYRILNRLLDKPAETLTLRKEMSVKQDALEQRVGRFLLTPIFALTITREGDRLYCQATDQPKYRIYAESENEFFYKAVNAQITFKLNDTGRAYMLTLHQNGLNLPGIRADGPATVPTSLNRGNK